MAHRIQISRAWCDECLCNCFHAYDESTGENQHVGNTTYDLGQYTAPLIKRGYLASHRNGVFTYTLYKDHLHPVPLEWQLLAESKEPEYLRDQDW